MKSHHGWGKNSNRARTLRYGGHVNKYVIYEFENVVISESN